MANFNFNKVILGGRLTADPELRQTGSGISVTTFSIAVNRRPFRSAEGQQQQTTADFINVVAWRGNAEFISKYFRKGSSICVVGSLQTRKWTDQQNNTRYSTEVVVDEVQFVDSKNDGGQFVPNAPAASSSAAASESIGAPTFTNGAAQPSDFEPLANDDDLPF